MLDVGDRVVADGKYHGLIINIRDDGRGENIYTLALDIGQEIITDCIWYARDFELKRELDSSNTSYGSIGPSSTRTSTI